MKKKIEKNLKLNIESIKDDGKKGCCTLHLDGGTMKVPGITRPDCARRAQEQGAQSFDFDEGGC